MIHNVQEKSVMQFARCLIVRSLLLCAFVLLSNSVDAQDSEISHDRIVGDYLFTDKDYQAVCYTIIYEEHGDVYALWELVDKAAKMEQVDSGSATYRVTFKSIGDVTLTFSQLADGRYNQLTLTGHRTDFRVDGQRHTSDLHRLREFHGDPSNPYLYHEPLQLTDGLQTGSIHDTRIDTTALYAVMNDLRQNNEYMHSMLVMKDGKLVVEEYFNGWDPVRLHRVQSVTKSVTSTLVGLAIEHGFVGSVDDSITTYLPNYDSLLDSNKKAIRIEHLLTMSAGFEWNEEATYYAAPEKCDAHLAGASGDFIGYVLAKPLVNEPGQYFEYNSGYPNILGHIIAKESGMTILEFAFDHLFEPLGVQRAHWMPIYGEKEYRPGCAGGLKLTSRDMVKYGFLYLRDGVWNGKQVVDSNWVSESIEGKIETRHNTRYGYQWKRTHSLDGQYEIFFASGTGGQYIACLPALDAVVVTTAVYHTDKGDDVAMMLLNQVLPAIVGT
jgi:CubicO group peptidase (beta-lactamase class C family)